MPPEIEKWKHIGDWIDGELVCRPDCPSEAHKKHPAAVALGTLGGKAKTKKKRLAVIENLKKARAKKALLRDKQ